jgi:hypothetical protein
VDPDPGTSSGLPPGEGDVDRTWVGWVREQLLEPRGAEVADHVSIAAREERGELPSAACRRLLADEVDTAVQRAKQPGAQAALDRAAGYATGEKLGATDHPVLSCGDGHNHAIGVPNRRLGVALW